MKKIIITSLFLVISIPCFSQSVETVDALLRNGLNKNFDSIQQEAYLLDDLQRTAIYNQYKQNLWIGGVTNCLFSLWLTSTFGMFNFAQEDYVGGYISLIGCVTGAGLVLVGLGGSLYYSGCNKPPPPIWPGVVAMSGFAIYFSSSIFGVVRSYVYPHSYNKKLKESLHISKAVTYDIAPEFAVTPNGADVTLIRIRF